MKDTYGAPLSSTSDITRKSKYLWSGRLLFLILDMSLQEIHTTRVINLYRNQSALKIANDIDKYID